MDADKINHDAGLPPYLQLAAILRRQIASGELVKKLPSQRTLAQQHDVAESTVRKALAVLVGEGLVVKHQGWGTEILGPPS